MSAICTAPCSDWTNIADVCNGDCSEIPEGILEDSIAWASGLLFEWSGRQFPGSCQDTVRPCGGSCFSQGRSCSCRSISEIPLGRYPVTGIVEVLLNDSTNPDWPGSSVLSSSLYRIDDYRTLVRLANPDGSRPSWPGCQDIGASMGAEDTFSVEFTYGVMPPPIGVRAAVDLACQLALGCCNSAKCRLPEQVRSVARQGVSMEMIDPSTFTDKGRIGIFSVDSFLDAVNPNRLKGRAMVLSPDTGARVRRANT